MMIDPPRDALSTSRQLTRGRLRLQQHRSIEVGGATLECTFYGSGTPVVLLANAGCSVGYFDHLARALATGGFQTISINMRGVGGSLGSLHGTTLHDLAGDLAGFIETIGCGPAHLVGHAFGNRIARCLAIDRPSLVCTATLLAAGGLIRPPTPLGTPFRNATQVKMNGSDCVTVLGARWLSPTSDPKYLHTSNAGRRCMSPTSRPAGVWRSKTGGAPEQPRFS
jgi:pimeloyl-ACP methyl ester carboxylesterase